VIPDRKKHFASVSDDAFASVNITQYVPSQKFCTRLAAASDKVYQLLAQGRWFSLGTPASSSTKTGRHDIAEITPKIKIIKNKYE
jgi:hypothetical protein